MVSSKLIDGTLHLRLPPPGVVTSAGGMSGTSGGIWASASAGVGPGSFFGGIYDTSVKEVGKQELMYDRIGDRLGKRLRLQLAKPV